LQVIERGLSAFAPRQNMIDVKNHTDRVRWALAAMAAGKSVSIHHFEL
jgi:hypothetical protein